MPDAFRTSPSASTLNNPKLVRGLGLTASTAIVVGGTIGTGIFVAPGIVARDTGTAALSLLVWGIGGALSLAGALCFAELASALPNAGGIYAYLRHAYRTPLLAFLCAWTFFFVSGAGSIAAVATAFASYLSYFLPAATVTNTTVLRAIAVACILLLTWVNYLGVRTGGLVQTVVTTLKVLAMAAVVAIAFSYPHGDWAHFASRDSASRSVAATFAGVGVALIPALFAYGGWSYSAAVAEEVDDPRRNVPRSIFLGMAAVFVVYLTVNMAYLYVLPFSAVQRSDHVASDAMRAAVGVSAGGLIAALVMLSALGALNALILSYARIGFAAARDGLLFRPLSRVHPTYRTPAAAIVVQGIVASLFAMSGDYERILGYFGFVEYSIFSLSIAAVIVLRVREPALDRPYRVWAYPLPPIIFLVGIGLYLINLLVTRPGRTSVGVLLVASGLPFYLYWRRRIV